MITRRDTLRGSLLALGLCLTRFFPAGNDEADEADAYCSEEEAWYMIVGGNEPMRCQIGATDGNHIAIAFEPYWDDFDTQNAPNWKVIYR